MGERQQQGLVAGGVGTRPRVGVSPSVLLDLQRAAGNRAVSSMIAREPAVPRVTTEDVQGIVDGHLATWYTSMRDGVFAADLADEHDEWQGWFYVSLAGNLLWAATAFVAPEAKAAVRTMSAIGAVVGSGAAEKALGGKTEAPSAVKDLKRSVVQNLSDQYKRMQGDAALTARVEAELGRRGLMENANDAANVQERRRVAWAVLFRDGIHFQDPYSIESESRRTVEAIWHEFQPLMREFASPTIESFVARGRVYRSPERYAAVAFKTALVRSGVLNGLPGFDVSYVLRRTPDRPVVGSWQGKRAYADDLYARYTLPDGAQVDVDVQDAFAPVAATRGLRTEYGRAGEDWSPFRQSYDAQR